MKKRQFLYSFKLYFYAAKEIKGLVILETLWVLVKLMKTLFVDIFLLKYLIDAVTKGRPFIEAVWFIILCAVIAFAEMYLQDWIREYVLPASKCKLHLATYKKIFKKVILTDTKDLDDTEFYNDYLWVMKYTDQLLLDSIENYKNFLSSFLTIGSILVVLATIHPMAIVFSLIPMIFVARIGTKLNQQEYLREKALTPVRRKTDYLKRVFYLKQFAEDIKTTKISNVICDNFEKGVQEEIKIQNKYGKKRFSLLAIQDSSYGIVQLLGLYVYLAYQAIVKNAFSIGSCTAIISAVDRLNGYFYQMSTVMIQAQRVGLFSEKFFAFLAAVSDIEAVDANAAQAAKAELQTFHELSVSNLAFTYPNSNTKAIDGISFTIQKGEKIAVVGENGAGKTTLVKLLLRLYDPGEGRILLNGKDIRHLDVHQYRKYFNIVSRTRNCMQHA